MSVSTDFQVLIAGAGPAGSLLARQLASAGVSVAVYEIRADEDALGHNWSDAVEKTALADAGFEIPLMENGRFKGRLVKTHETDDNLFEPHGVNPLQIWSPDLTCRTRSDVDFQYITTDRKVLGRRLAQQARDAGAKMFYQHRCQGLLGETDGSLEDIAVRGLRVTDMGTGQTGDVSAGIVVDATGYLSALRTGLGKAPAINRAFGQGDLAYACRTVRELDVSRAPGDNLSDHYRYGAYQGYFWTHRHHEDVIDVGGGVPKEPGRIDPKTVIEEMIAQRPSITEKELRGGGGTVLVGRSPGSLAAGGFVAVGDAAGQVIPTTGCGVGGAMNGALMAAETIRAALDRNDFSLEALWGYNRQWFAGRGSHFAALSALKQVLQALSHADITCLMKKDILSGQMLTPSINGIFEPPDLAATGRTLLRGLARPDLLMQLNRATGLGKKIFQHYRKYPEKWQPASFYRWSHQAEKLFEKIGKPAADHLPPATDPK
ncbi:MAG: NAD(P)/FAD-dependent oxidoreductase [Thermodesulfobacteriota bacterium]